METQSPASNNSIPSFNSSPDKCSPHNVGQTTDFPYSGTPIIRPKQFEENDMLWSRESYNGGKSTEVINRKSQKLSLKRRSLRVGDLNKGVPLYNATPPLNSLICNLLSHLWNVSLSTSWFHTCQLLATAAAFVILLTELISHNMLLQFFLFHFPYRNWGSRCQGSFSSTPGG